MNTQPEQPKQRRGCMFYVGVCALILFMLVLVGVAVGYMTVRKAVRTWTDTQPARLPRTEMSQSEVAQIHKRVEAFNEAVKTGGPAQVLVLTAREINGLIENNPDFAHLKGRVHLDVASGQARGQVSIPLEQTGVGLLKGRYLNGTGRIKSSLEAGNLRLTLEEVQVNGKTLPDTLMTRIRGVNFAQQLNDDPKSSEFLKKLAAIEIKEDKVEIVPQAKDQ